MKWAVAARKGVPFRQCRPGHIVSIRHDWPYFFLAGNSVFLMYSSSVMKPSLFWSKWT